jgi:acetylglutamate kinase
MRILIAGDPTWHCRRLAVRIVQRLVQRYGPDIVIVHGGGCGVDESFNRACAALDVGAESHYVTDTLVRQYGRQEREHRNREMVEAGAELCVVLHRDIANGAGTKDLVRQALAAGIPVYLIESAAARPRRIVEEDARLN